MISKTSPKAILSILIACTAPAWVHAADPTTSKLLEQCKSAQGEVKKECEEVATKMLQQQTQGQEHQQQRRPSKTGQDVTHSSPVMDTTDAKPAKPAKSAPAKPADKPEPKLE